MATDILLTDTGDIDLSGSDIVLGTSNQQQSQILLIAEKGSIRQFPTVGVGAVNYLESEDVAGLLREVRMQFTQDGQNVESISFSNNQLNIKSDYPQ